MERGPYKKWEAEIYFWLIPGDRTACFATNGLIGGDGSSSLARAEHLMGVSTVIPGVLCVGSALPDPPFEFMDGDEPRGFDVELMQAIAAELGLAWRLIPYTGADFNGIFGGLARGMWDCVASGATITPERVRLASFCTPRIIPRRSSMDLTCAV